MERTLLTTLACDLYCAKHRWASALHCRKDRDRRGQDGVAIRLCRRRKRGSRDPGSSGDLAAARSIGANSAKLPPSPRCPNQHGQYTERMNLIDRKRMMPDEALAKCLERAGPRYRRTRLRLHQARACCGCEIRPALSTIHVSLFGRAGSAALVPHRVSDLVPIETIDYSNPSVGGGLCQDGRISKWRRSSPCSGTERPPRLAAPSELCACDE